MIFDVLIIGGGAAGFFAAINTKQKNPNYNILILEKGKDCLEKVRISGGGRCNVTNACTDIDLLLKNYPRGEKELKSAFHQFKTSDTVNWFKKQNIVLKTEPDGRMFPDTNQSETIVNCFLNLAHKLYIKVNTQQTVKSLQYKDEVWQITTQDTTYFTNKLVIATGSNTKIWNMLQEQGHNIIQPVPSLFSFKIKDERLSNLMGISANVSAKICDTKISASGNMLITHWGLSGPAILKLSAWGARELFEKKYNFLVQINWLNNLSETETIKLLEDIKLINSKKRIHSFSPFSFPKRLWENLLSYVKISNEKNWADVSKKEIHSLAKELTQSTFVVLGKNTFKEEFVTAGGVSLKEIDFKTMKSKVLPNVYFAGEVLNIDAITGGFNFQNAWTGAFIASQNL